MLVDQDDPDIAAETIGIDHVVVIEGPHAIDFSIKPDRSAIPAGISPASLRMPPS
jgi:hypothetical protein